MSAPNVEGKNLFQRLVMVKQAIGHVGKTAKAPPEMGGFMFTPWEAVADRLGDILADHGIVLLPGMVSSEQHEAGTTRQGKTIYRTRVRIELTFVNADKPEERETRPWEGEGDDMADKGTQKAATSAEKYALMKLFLLGSLGGADDSDRGSPEAAGATRTRVVASAPPAANGNGSKARVKIVDTTPTGRNCPDCGDGDLVVKRLEDGNAFVGCSNYPNCKHTEKVEQIPAATPVPVGVTDPDDVPF